MQADYPEGIALRARAFGEVMRTRRLKLGLSVTMLANWAGIQELDIATIERGERPTAPVRGVHSDVFSRMAWGLRWTLDELVAAIDSRATELMQHRH